uniref:Uncharacterized protein n=1 Tax=Caenorhabditis japonica TaxID=281687 RepID=A0A8R1HIC4_CAEJA
RSKYAQLNQPLHNGTPPENAGGNTPLGEEEEFEEEYEDIEEEVELEPGKGGQTVSSRRRARRQRAQNLFKVMARGRFHEIQAMREEVVMTHGNARD